MDQLLLTYNTVSKNTDLGEMAGIILSDFSKAFDVVFRDIMIDKFNSIGLKGKLIDWISSFSMEGRCKYVLMIE